MVLINCKWVVLRCWCQLLQRCWCQWCYCNWQCCCCCSCWCCLFVHRGGTAALLRLLWCWCYSLLPTTAVSAASVMLRWLTFQFASVSDEVAVAATQQLKLSDNYSLTSRSGGRHDVTVTVRAVRLPISLKINLKIEQASFQYFFGNKLIKRAREKI